MRFGISYKLALVLAATNLAALGLFVVMVERSLSSGFLDYVKGVDERRAAALAERLVMVYQEQGDWRFLRDRPERLQQLLGMELRNPPPRRDDRGKPGGRPPRDGRPPPRDRGEGASGKQPGGKQPKGERPTGERPPPRPPGEAFDPQSPPLELERRIAIDDHRGQALLGDPLLRESADQYPLELDGQRIGTLFVYPPPQISDEVDLAFVDSQQRALWIAAGSALLLALLTAAFLGGRLVRPLREVTAAAQSLAGGDFSARVESQRQDELGDLGRDFNQLAQALAHSRAERRRLLGDISHELRTPLSILRGELDAVDDGVRPLGPHTLKSLDAEVTRLASLVDDLGELARSDAGGLSYQMTAVDLGELLRSTCDDFAAECERADLQCQFAGPTAGVAIVRADLRRLEQLSRNLMRNSLRYTEAPGSIHVAVRKAPGGWWVVWEDSAPSVPEHALEKLFDRLYRVDESRSRATGGAGIGLSIVHNVAKAHGGSVTAAQSALGGLAITVFLPEQATS